MSSALVRLYPFKKNPTAMTIRTLRPPVVSLDAAGRRILLVPLANCSKHARVHPEDYERLLAEGYSPNWCLNRGTVKASDWRHNAPRIARLIAGVGPGDPVQVRHRNGDSLDLRSENLRVLPIKMRNSTHRAA